MAVRIVRNPSDVVIWGCCAWFELMLVVVPTHFEAMPLMVRIGHFMQRD